MGFGLPPTIKNMPFITTNKIQIASHDLIGIEHKGDKTYFNHIQNVTDTLQFCHNMREAPGNGFSDKRQLRQIGQIPAIEYIQHPEWHDDPDLILDWLRKEGGDYTTVKGGI